MGLFSRNKSLKKKPPKARAHAVGAEPVMPHAFTVTCVVLHVVNPPLPILFPPVWDLLSCNACVSLQGAIADWTHEDVVQWLQYRGLERYEPALRSITGRVRNCPPATAMRHAPPAYGTCEETVTPRAFGRVHAQSPSVPPNAQNHTGEGRPAEGRAVRLVTASVGSRMLSCRLAAQRRRAALADLT